METLLCRRFELALSSGRPLEQADPQVRTHPDECARCRAAMLADREIAEVLIASGEALPAAARRRIDALVSAEARAEREPRSRRPLTMAWAAAAAIVLVASAGAWTIARSQSADSEAAVAERPEVPQVTHGEPISGLSEMIARHNGSAGPPASVLPKGALLYQSRVPASLRSSLAAREQSAVNYVSASTVDDDATLFVLSREHIALDPVMDDILTADGAITLAWDGHQITLAPRDDRLFVVVSSPHQGTPRTGNGYL